MFRYCPLPVADGFWKRLSQVSTHLFSGLSAAQSAGFGRECGPREMQFSCACPLPVMQCWEENVPSEDAVIFCCPFPRCPLHRVEKGAWLIRFRAARPKGAAGRLSRTCPFLSSALILHPLRNLHPTTNPTTLHPDSPNPLNSRFH